MPNSKSLIICIWTEVWKSFLALLFLGGFFAIVWGLGYMAILLGVWLFTHFSWIAVVVGGWLVICVVIGIGKWAEG